MTEDSRPLLKLRGSDLWQRAIRLQCPTCGRGKPFPGWFRIEPHCEFCGFAYAREPGYFLGSIYLNYGVTGLIVIAWVVIAFFGFGLGERALVAGPIILILVFPLWFLRYSRALWMAIDLAIDPPAADEFAAGAEQPKR